MKMHLPYISASLPRKWKSPPTSAPPVTVTGSPTKSDGKPPKSSTKTSSGGRSSKRLSTLFRSASFSEKPPVTMDGKFKVPQPPAPSVAPLSRIVLPSAAEAESVMIRRHPLQPCVILPSGDSCTTFGRDWRSQSLADLILPQTPKANRPEPSAGFEGKKWFSGTSPRVSSSCDGLHRLGLGQRDKNPGLATIFSKNLRSNSWRNLTTIDRVDSFKGATSQSQHVGQGLKKVSAPSVPASVLSGSESFASSADPEETLPGPRFPHLVIPSVVGLDESLCKRYRERTKDIGWESPSDESNVSCITEGSTSSKGGRGRNSLISLDSGRASSSNTDTLSQHGFTVYQPNQSLPLSPLHKLPGGSPFRSGQPLSSLDQVGDSKSPKFLWKSQDHDGLLTWLTELHFMDYYNLFVSAGYDMPTIVKMTPEDLTAIGIKNPNHRKKIKEEILKLDIPDGLPNYIPNSLEKWLQLINLAEYSNKLKSQGYFSIDQVIQISIEDLEDVGFFKLGHQKRFLLAVKRIKDLKAGKINPCSSSRMARLDLRNDQVTRYQSCAPLGSGQSIQSAAYPGRFLFQQHCDSKHYTPGSQPPANSYQPTYHPDIIMIQNKSSSLLPIKTDTSWRNTPSPSPSPPPGLTMPLPMMPLPTFLRYHSFGRGGNQISAFGQGQVESGKEVLGTFREREGIFKQNPTSFYPSGSGTLPRLSGGVKSRPVAKIPAHCRDPVSSTTLGRHFRDQQLHNEAKSIHIERDGQNKGISTAFPRESPFRMKSSPRSHKESEISAFASQGQLRSSSSSRSPTDVLNDIGTMLADLTHELDAMLQSETKQS